MRRATKRDNTDTTKGNSAIQAGFVSFGKPSLIPLQTHSHVHLSA